MEEKKYKARVKRLEIENGKLKKERARTEKEITRLNRRLHLSYNELERLRIKVNKYKEAEQATENNFNNLQNHMITMRSR